MPEAPEDTNMNNENRFPLHPISAAATALSLTLACVVTGQRWHVGAHVHRPDAPVPDELESLFADARATMIPPGIRVRERAPVAPSPARGLTELAESEGADLIVIGSSQHASGGRIRLERTAGRLL